MFSTFEFENNFIDFLLNQSTEKIFALILFFKNSINALYYINFYNFIQYSD